MSLSTKRLFAGLGAVAMMSMSAANAHSGLSAGPHAKSGVVKVHGDWDDENGRWERRRRHHRERYVVAPFTDVETGRRVVVDAPFAHVTVDRHGRFIRAPFVNLWVPR